MKKIILLLSLFVSITMVQAKDKGPKVDMNGDTVTVDGVNQFIFEKIKPVPGIYNYYIKSLDGKKLAFLKFQDYHDPKEISSANPNGRVSYYEVTFLESNQIAEIMVYARQIKMAEYIVKLNLVKNGEITPEAEQEFIMVNGREYSRKRNELNGGNTIIINNSEPEPKNKFNINIGR